MGNHNHNLFAPEDEEDSDAFVDNFENVDDSEHEIEGIQPKKPPSTSSNDSDIGIDQDLINETEREMIRQHELESDTQHGHEPGSIPPLEFPMGINSNVELIEFEKSQSRRREMGLGLSMSGCGNDDHDGDDDENKRKRRKSCITTLNCSMTSQFNDDSFVCDVEAEEEEEEKEKEKLASNRLE